VAVAVLIGGALLVQQPLIGILVMVVTVLIGLVVAGRRTWKTRAVTKYKRDVAAWNRSVATKWGRLCYCHRCEQVFSPGSSSAMSPEDWRQSLGMSPSDRWADRDLAGIVEAAMEHPRPSSSRPGDT
jgi:hypothetical protein